MATGDGLLVRLRLTGGIVSFDRARAIAACADQYGNGLIDLSSRANLQLRGVTPETLAALTAELERLQLLDASAEAEAVRNIVASPLSGIDPDAVLDIGPVVAALEAALVNNSLLHQLPGKFGFLIDDGGAISLSQVAADVRFEAFAGPQGPRFAILLAAAGEASCIGECTPDELTDCAARLAAAFLALRGDADDAPRRMRDVVARVGAAAVAEAAGFKQARLTIRPTHEFDIRRVVGQHRIGTVHSIGIAMPFGRLSGKALAELARLAEHHGARDLRLTPWRVIIVAGVPVDAAASLTVALRAARFILDADDPLLSVAACPGAPACHNATTPVQEDAARLALLLQRPFAKALSTDSIVLHVSGCAKGCAHAAVSPFTLVGNAGRYDLVEQGTARDAPIVSGLGAPEIRSELLARIERSIKERSVAAIA
jgi:precorrin-3B synthase